MISPASQKVIQIDITNACPNRCANCTRFVGHHKKPFMMSLDAFKRAVDSLKDFPGMVGVMGGEPTLHPDFEEMATYLKQIRPENVSVPSERFAPVKSFSRYAYQNLGVLPGRRNGLWSSLGPGYYKHFETIQDTFGYQCLNDHKHDGAHISLLMTREELGISDSEWFPLRDNCWIQREWSASITPKGAFFCEVAAALDMLYDGPGGWHVEPGWWMRGPKDFKSQLHWCEMCSACLPVPRSVAADGRDIISPIHAGKLSEVNSPKLKSNMVDVIDLKTYRKEDHLVNHICEPYLPDQGPSARISPENTSTKPKDIKIIMVCVGYDDYLSETLPRNIRTLGPEIQPSDILVITDKSDLKTHKVCQENHVPCFISSRIHAEGSPLSKGKAINEALSWLKPKDWVLITDADILFPNRFMIRVFEMTLNPGALYFTRRWGPKDISEIPDLLKDFDDEFPVDLLFESFANQEFATIQSRIGNAIEQLPFGYFQMFNMGAKSLRYRDTLYEEKSRTAEHDDGIFGLYVYPSTHRVALPLWDFDVIHLPHGKYTSNWSGRKTPRIDKETAHV